jgi:hypothetical protein
MWGSEASRVPLASAPVSVFGSAALREFVDAAILDETGGVIGLTGRGRIEVCRVGTGAVTRLLPFLILRWRRHEAILPRVGPRCRPLRDVTGARALKIC